MNQIPIIERRKEDKYIVLFVMSCFVFTILTIIFSEQIENYIQLDEKIITLTFVVIMAILLLFMNLKKNYLVVGKLIILKDDLKIEFGTETIDNVKIVGLNISNYKGQVKSMLDTVKTLFPEEKGIGNYVEVELQKGKRKFELFIESERIYNSLLRIKQDIKI